MKHLNPDSLVVAPTARIEPAVADDAAGSHYQFERLGYFVSDIVESRPGSLVFNRTVTLRDTWKRLAQPAAPSAGRPDRGKSKPRRDVAEVPVEQRDRTAAVDSVYRGLIARHGLSPADADVIARDAAVAAFFEAAISSGQGRAHAGPVANWIIHELPRELGDRALSDVPFDARSFASFVALTEDGTLSSSAARTVLSVLVSEGGDPAAIVDRLGLRQVSDASSLEPVVLEVIEANADKVTAYRAGRTGLIGFFIGQVMSRTGGTANPEVVRTLLEKSLDNV